MQESVGWLVYLDTVGPSHSNAQYFGARRQHSRGTPRPLPIWRGIHPARECQRERTCTDGRSSHDAWAERSTLHPLHPRHTGRIEHFLSSSRSLQSMGVSTNSAALLRTFASLLHSAIRLAAGSWICRMVSHSGVHEYVRLAGTPRLPCVFSHGTHVAVVAAVVAASLTAAVVLSLAVSSPVQRQNYRHHPCALPKETRARFTRVIFPFFSSRDINWSSADAVSRIQC